MKKIIVFAIILAITAAALMLNVTVSAEEDNFNFARIFASGGDPYLYVHFSGGKSIDPDSTQWTAIKYRSGAKNDGAVIDVVRRADEHMYGNRSIRFKSHGAGLKRQTRERRKVEYRCF